MIGTIIGDVAGSIYEFDNHKSKEFELLQANGFCDALMKSKDTGRSLQKQAVESMQTIGQPYPDCGFGGRFYDWIYQKNPLPYKSYGNGAAMRVSGCAYVGRTLHEVITLAYQVTKVSHNHPEGLKGAEATAVAVFLARTGKTKEEIRAHITERYYPLDFTIDSIRPDYSFDVSCQGSVPQAMEAFLESADFEDAIRTAVSVGGDSDTIAAITGSIAEAYYGVPKALREKALTYLDDRLRRILKEFERRYPSKTI